MQMQCPCCVYQAAGCDMKGGCTLSSICHYLRIWFLSLLISKASFLAAKLHLFQGAADLPLSFKQQLLDCIQAQRHILAPP